MRILELRLLAPAPATAALAGFYTGVLGLPPVADRAGPAFRAGTTVLEFRPAGGRPFYHFAARVPRNRFRAAHAALAERSELLPDPETGSTVFDFPAWDAEACYAHDPCENIVELIAHRNLPEEAAEEPELTGRDVLGVCEVGLVGRDARAMAGALATLGIRVWDGTVESPGRLAFAGAPDGTLILAPPGRGWVPTGRPAEVHPVEATVAGAEHRQIALPGTPHVVRTTPAA